MCLRDSKDRESSILKLSILIWIFEITTRDYEAYSISVVTKDNSNQVNAVKISIWEFPSSSDGNSSPGAQSKIFKQNTQYLDLELIETTSIT